MVKINDESRGTYGKDNQDLKPQSLSDYSDAHILVTGTVTAADTSGSGAVASNVDTNVIFKNCALSIY